MVPLSFPQDGVRNQQLCFTPANLTSFFEFTLQIFQIDSVGFLVPDGVKPCILQMKVVTKMVQSEHRNCASEYAVVPSQNRTESYLIDLLPLNAVSALIFRFVMGVISVFRSGIAIEYSRIVSLREKNSFCVQGLQF